MNEVTITGFFGDPWLHALWPDCVGPSPALYSFDTAKLVEVRKNGDALVQTVSRDGYSRQPFHPDGGPCDSYPCNHGYEQSQIIWRRVYYYKTRQAVVSAGSWHEGGRGIIHKPTS